VELHDGVKGCKSAEYVGSNWKGKGEAILSQGEKDANDEAQKDGMEGEKEYGHSNRGLRELSTGDAWREGSSNVKAEGAIASAFVGVAGKELEGVNRDDGGKDNEGESMPRRRLTSLLSRVCRFVPFFIVFSQALLAATLPSGVSITANLI
jgi:hypothetical protein